MTHQLMTFEDVDKLKPSLFTKIINFLRASAGLLKPQEANAETTTARLTNTGTSKISEAVKIDDVFGNFTITQNGVRSKVESNTSIPISNDARKLLQAKGITALNKKLSKEKSVTSKGLDTLNEIARLEKKAQDVAIAELINRNFETVIAGAGLSVQEIEDIKRLDERRAKSEGTLKFKKKRSGVETVALKRIEEQKAFSLLGAQNFSSTRGSQGRLKLFGKENFEFGGISKAEFDRRQAEEQARQQEVSKVTGLTRAQSNLQGQKTRQAQKTIENIIQGKITQSSIDKISKKLGVRGGLNEKSIASLLARGVITGDDL